LLGTAEESRGRKKKAMGNSIYRFLCGLCSQASQELGLHGAHPAVAALGRDVLNFEATSQVTVVRVLPSVTTSCASPCPCRC
jgi:hypothetical protein